ncbi:uncharacterized protein LOC121379835 [Gigantopelta aegis]|uniref:uncharacterized protein LOC121379835 n=1 Tax=Gigantopelta aegis TaxID=1735272 RepID=UPI001B887A92|nr:uncharacterized protein LOC121379835 [Gigantopelta aegis]
MGEIGGVVKNDGSPVVLDGYNLIAYDWYNGILGMQSHLVQPDKSMRVTNVTIDYNTKTQYVTLSDGTCIESDVTEHMREPCVPASSKLLTSSYLGFGNNALHINVWEYLKPGTDNIVKLAVTDPGCIPVIEASYGTMKGGKTDIVYFITDFQPGIAQPELLAKPTFPCRRQGANDEDIPDDLVRSIKSVKQIYSH